MRKASTSNAAAGVSRRGFLATGTVGAINLSAGSGLMLGFHAPLSQAQSANPEINC